MSSDDNKYLDDDERIAKVRVDPNAAGAKVG
jgi:hypothetical protein